MERESERLISTGIDKFNEILGGGIPRNSMILFLTDIGSESDIVALQILWNRLKAGDLGVIYDFDLPPMDLREKMKTYGWNLKKYEEEGKFILADMFTHAFDLESFYPKEKYYCKRPTDITYIGNFAHKLREEILQRTQPGEYFGVILSAGRLLHFTGEDEALKFVYASRMKYKPLGTALYLLDPRIASEKGLAMLENFADIVIRFSVEKVSNRFNRFLRVIKSPLFGYLKEPLHYTITPTEGAVLSKD